MNSNVYHVHFLDHQLPESEEDKVQFARDYAVELTGASPDDITCFIQKHTGDPSYRVTISVPQRLADSLKRVGEFGLEPVFEEPEKPYVDGDSCIVPGSFQVKHFGVNIDPIAVSDHPERQGVMASVLTEHVPDLPEVAKDFLNWRYIEADEETGLIAIFWGGDGEYGPEEYVVE